MGRVSIKTIPLKVQALGRLRELIYNELRKNTDIQIYVEKSLYKEIKFNFFDYNMSIETDNLIKHYSDYVQDNYELQDKRGRREGFLTFTSNCNGYMQVIRFKMENIEYVHYNSGMKKIIIFTEEEEEN